jgi:hypothetical protein
MQIREIDPNETNIRYSETESAVSKIPVPKFSMPSFARKPPVQPVPKVAQMQPEPTPPHRTKPRVIIRPPEPVEPVKATQVHANIVSSRPMPTPLPVYVPPDTDYEYPNSEAVYGKARYDPVAIAATRPVQAPRQHFKLNFSMKKMPLLIAEGVAGFVAIYFGLTQTGSYYTPASRFAGDLATVFYGYQLGTLMAMVGVVLIYDAIRRAGNL